jgi:thymidine kinase
MWVRSSLTKLRFFDERIAYVVRNHSWNGHTLHFPTSFLNFRRDNFNSTARLMLDIATDVSR